MIWGRVKGLINRLTGLRRQAARGRRAGKAASAPVYRLYRLSYRVGRFAIAIAASFAGVFQVFWNVALSELFDKGLEKFRRVSEFKQSRMGRGELSLARMTSRIVRNTAGAVGAVALAFVRSGPAEGFTVLGRLSAGAAGSFWHRNKKAFNYVAPALGVIALALTINYLSQFTFALSVSYDGRQIGVISNEQEFRSALYQIETNVTSASGQSFKLGREPVFKTVLAKRSDFATQDNLYDNIIMASSKDVFKGYGLYVDNRLIGANSDGASIQTMLAKLLEPYQSDPRVQKAEFVQNVQIKSGVFPSTISKPVVSMQALLTATVEDQQSYKAQKGDSPIKIATMYHLSLDQLYAMNPSLGSDQLTEGQNVLVKSSREYLTVKTIKNEVYNEAVPFRVQKVQSDALYQGETKVQTKGQPGEQQVVASVSYVGGAMTGKTVLSATVTKAPVDEQDLIGTKQKPSAQSIFTNGYDLPPLSASGSAKAGGIIGYAESCLGIRYVSGGASRNGFDCSGYTMYVYSRYGVSLAHSAAAQFGTGRAVSRSSLRKGDLVFFDTDGGHNSITHVGIYAGGNTFLQASSRNPNRITVTSMSDRYWSSRYMGARRVLS